MEKVYVSKNFMDHFKNPVPNLSPAAVTTTTATKSTPFPRALTAKNQTALL